MSQIEQQYYRFVRRHPEIRAAKDLINVRAVARLFMQEEKLSRISIEAVVAMIRRADVTPVRSFTQPGVYKDIAISIKDEIVILDYEKQIVEKLKDVVSMVNYGKGETLKVSVGTQSVKIIVDSANRALIKKEIGTKHLIKEYKNISEISMHFSNMAHDTKGIVAHVTSEMLLNDITIAEIITCTPELIVYVEEEYSLRAYELVKRIKRGKG